MNQQFQSPIDVNHLNQISEGDIEFEIEVLQVYVEDTIQRIATIQFLISNQDQKGIMAEAHHIKGASANVGALEVQSLAVKMEDLASSQNFEPILGLIEDIQVQMKAIEQFVAEKVVALSA